MSDLLDVDDVPLASISETVRILGCTPTQIRNWIRRGHLHPQHYKIEGGPVRVLLDLDEVRDVQRDTIDRRRGLARHE